MTTKYPNLTLYLRVYGESGRDVTTSTEHVRSTAEHESILATIIYLVLSPQLLIPPHSMQAEASGGTIFSSDSMRIPAKLRGLRSTFDPVQE